MKPAIITGVRIAVVLVVTLAVLAQTPTDEPKVAMMYCAMPKEPAQIVELKPVGKFSAAITLKNVGTYGNITDYVVGYFTSADKQQRRLGMRVRLSRPLRAGEVGPASVEGVNKWRGKAPDKLVFFVARVSFTDNSAYLAAPLYGVTKFTCVEH